MVLVSALNEDLDRTSVHYAAQVFRESFLKSARAGEMGVPTVPLTELYRIGGEYILERGGEVRLRASVDALSTSPNKASMRVGESTHDFDQAILAVPYNTLVKLLPKDAAGLELSAKAERFESSPITGIHLWFDRQITELDHAVLLDRTIQWMFHKSRLLERHSNGAGAAGSYVELVVSSSKALVEKTRQEVIDLALAELVEFFPAAKDAKLVKAAVIKEVHATYSAQPLSDQYRPPAVTGWPNIFLAGDWTATGWPATMEGAVRSGYKAAEALTRALGRKDTFLVSDLKASGLMRLFG